MGKTLKVPHHIHRYIWALLVIPLVVTILPYGLIWTLWPPQGTREFLTDFRFWGLVWIVLSGTLSWIKIGLYSLGFLRNEKTERNVDIVLSLFIYVAYGLLVVCYVPVLIVLLVVAHFATKENVTGVERWSILALFGMLIIFVFVIGWYFTAHGHLELGAVVVLSYCTLFVILIALAFFSKDTRISNAKRIIDGAIYIISCVCSFVLGLPVIIKGKILDWIYFIVSNHEGAFEYAGGIWTYILKWRVSKILAGDNLGDFPIVGDFIALKTITVKGRRREREYKGVIGAILKFLILVKKGLVWFFTLQFIWKKKPKPKVVTNIKLLREIPRNIKKGILVWVPPKGRERLSDDGVLKKIDPMNLEGIDVLQATLCLGPMRYKPANKKEKHGKKWYQQQFWLSPRKIMVYHLNPIRRRAGETNQEYSVRIWVIMTAAKTKFTNENDLNDLYAQFRLAFFVARIARAFKRVYRWMLSSFDEHYI